VWKKYFDAVRADLAGVLYANSKVGDYTYGEFDSKEEARSYVDRALDKMKGGRAAMGGESVEGSGPSDLMQYYD
jgi:hypothetical protein